MERIRDNVVNFAKFMKPPEGWDRVRPAQEYGDRVKERLFRDTAEGDTLPWSETNHKVRFRTGEVSVWGGRGGHKKSILTSQCAVGWMAQGAKLFVASLEMPVERTLERMARQAIGVDEPTEREIRKFVEWSDGRLWVYDELGNQSWRKIVALCRWAAEELGATHCLIDSLMMCGITPHDVDAARAFMDGLGNNSKYYKMHIHLVAHSKKSGSEHRMMIGDDIAGTPDIYNKADNVFLLWQNIRKLFERDKPEVDRKDKILHQPDALLRCAKQRFGPWEGWIRLWFEGKSLQHLTSEGAAGVEMMSMGGELF